MDSSMDYESAVAFIESIQDLTSLNSTITIDIGTLFADRMPLEPFLYDKAGEIIDSVEGGRRMVETGASQPQQKAPKMTIQQPRKLEVSKEIFDATAEIRDIVSKAGATIKNEVKPPEPEKAAPLTKLVLPTLSIQDQISELESISIGLDDKAFDSDNLLIVQAEIKGLVDSKKDEKNPVDSFQKNLMIIRDQRLNEVIRKLGIKNN